MTKAKWLSVSVPFGINEVAEQLSALEFRRGETRGVDLNNVDSDYVSGRYIEETIDTEIYTDPFGEEIRNEIRRYSVFSFTLFPWGHERFILRVDNPPRSIKSFISFLSESFGFGFSAAALTIDVIAFIDNLRKHFGDRHCVIKKVRIGNVRIGSSSLARIEATSSSDAYADLLQNLKLEGATVERASVNLKHESCTGCIELTSSAALAGDVDLIATLTPLCIEFFRDQLTNIR